jgi:glycosyltransferase involved in cell wall biosynthesis
VNVLVVSQYFPPEPGATQNRLGTFSDALAARGHDVTVVCEQPCHPGGRFEPGFGRRPVMTERKAEFAAEGGSMTVRRLWVAASPEKTPARRLAFYGSFAAGVGIAGALESRPDVVFATSPPLPGALVAGAVAQARRLPFVLDVRDLWPAAAEALGELSNRTLLRGFERAERWLYRSASRVTATTQPFCRHIDALAGRTTSVHLPNGALDALVDLPDTDPPASPPFVVGYAGNLGIAQGLSIVVDAAERLRGDPAQFVLVGDGPVNETLRRKCEGASLPNVEFRSAVPVERIGDFLQACHALLVPLRAHPLLADFVPSKLFDAMAAGRPVILAAAGEAAGLVRDASAGVVVDPEDGAGLARAVRALMDDPDQARRMAQAGRAAARASRRSAMVERLEGVLLDAAGLPAAPG